MDLSGVISQMLILFGVIIVGYITGKLNILDLAANKVIARLINMVTLPALILSSAISGNSMASTGKLFFILFLSLLTYAFYIAVSIFLPKLFRISEKDIGLYRFMLIFGNVGFMGIPVISAIFGKDAVLYVAVFNLPFNLLVFSVGLLLITGGEKTRFSWRLFTAPGSIAAVLSIIIFSMHITFPAVVIKITSLIGSITTPAAMLIIGSALAFMPVKDIFSDGKVYFLSFIKLIILPMLLWMILRLFVHDQIILGIVIVVAAMPVATLTSILSYEYNGDQLLAARGIFISTLISVFTIPLIAYLLFI
ncbi:MAG: AEC family transporter [Clostridiales bacterium]|nr:AEC family transporter [Clostridiales bacterium]